MIIYSKLLNKEISIDSFQGDDGKEVLSKNSLLDFYLNELPKEMPDVHRKKTFDPIKTDQNHCLCKVTIVDSKGRHVEECGESNNLTLKSEVDKENPFGTAFNRASDKAIRRYLGLPQNVYSSSELPSASGNGAATNPGTGDQKSSQGTQSTTQSTQSAPQSTYDYGDIVINLGAFSKGPKNVRDVVTNNLDWAKWAIAQNPLSFGRNDAGAQIDAIKTYMKLHNIS